MNNLLTDEDMQEIRRCSITDYEVADVTGMLQNHLRALLAHHDAMMSQSSTIITAGPLVAEVRKLRDELSHANSNADNLRIQVADLTETVATLKSVLRSDEDQLRMEQKRTQSAGDRVIEAIFDAAQYLTRAETAEQNLVKAQAELSDARSALFFQREAMVTMRGELVAILEAL